ncbi:hypothetical protein [Streptomyces scabiei]|nr:hypothetical protein [Streptomyces scabiei]MDX3522420.1 hypothetical protein [Streptomyces scabiei]
MTLERLLLAEAAARPASLPLTTVSGGWRKLCHTRQPVTGDE